MHHLELVLSQSMGGEGGSKLRSGEHRATWGIAATVSPIVLEWASKVEILWPQRMNSLTTPDSDAAEMGSQHPSPNVKTFCEFEPQIWLEIITSRDAKSACFKGSRTSCREIISGNFWPNFGQKRSHHVMDAYCCRKHLDT